MIERGNLVPIACTVGMSFFLGAFLFIVFVLPRLLTYRFERFCKKHPAAPQPYGPSRYDEQRRRYEEHMARARATPEYQEVCRRNKARLQAQEQARRRMEAPETAFDFDAAEAEFDSPIETLAAILAAEEFGVTWTEADRQAAWERILRDHSEVGDD